MPPLATASVPAKVTAPLVAEAGVRPVVPALNVDTPAVIAPIELITKAVLAAWVVLVPLDAVGTVGTPVKAGLAERTVEPVPVEVVTPVPPLATATMPVTFDAVPVVFWFRIGTSAT